MMKFKGESLQEHIWNSLEDIADYSTWDWVILFEHYNLSLEDDKDYNDWLKELKSEGKLK